MFKKLIRFSFIYGPTRTLVKSVGRLRVKVNLGLLINPLYVLFPPKKTVGFIGAGQFAFATVSYFIVSSRYARIVSVYDVSRENAATFSSAYKADVYSNALTLIDSVDVVFITSNHASHCEYAIQALKKEKIVYCEKPISVSHEQLKNLHRYVKRHPDLFFCGYNRPHSKIMKYTRKKYSKELASLPVSLVCYVRGHELSHDHWYRNDEEGTRVCGNLGHWVDLFFSIIWKRIGNIKEYKLNIISSDPLNPDDNVILSIVTNCGDLFNVTISSRCEPFEGIDETINLQVGDLNLKIDDFRSAKINYGSKSTIIKNLFKDVGHKNAIAQPFISDYSRTFKEYFMSSFFTVSFAEMIKNGDKERVILSYDVLEFFK